MESIDVTKSCALGYANMNEFPSHRDLPGSVRFYRPTFNTDQPRLQRNKATFLLRKRASSANLMASSGSTNSPIVESSQLPRPSSAAATRLGKKFSSDRCSRTYSQDITLYIVGRTQCSQNF